MTPLRFLLAEDDPSDRDLIVAHLEGAFPGAIVTCADEGAGFASALDRSPDLILCDYNIPGFGALAALEIVSERIGPIPLVVVTGAVGEEAAAECIKRGASDFLLKDNLASLQRVVTGALREAELRGNLVEVEARYRDLLETVPAVVYRAEPAPSCRWLYLSPQVEGLLGMAPEAFMESHPLWIEMVHPADRARVVASEEIALGTGDPLQLEYRMIRADGKTIWVRDEAVIVRGPRPYLHGFLTDITETRLAVDALRETEAHYRGLVESVNAIMWRADPSEGRMTYVSKEAEKVTGYPVSRWTSEPGFWEAHIHPDDRDRLVANAEEVRHGRRSMLNEYRFLTADGRIVWLRDNAQVRVEGGEVIELFGVAVDVTELKAAETEARIRAHQQAAVVELGQIAMGDPDPEELLNRTVQLVTKTLGVRCSLLVVVDPDTEELVVRATAGYGTGVVGRTIPHGTRSPEGYAVMSKLPVRSGDLELDRRFTFTPLEGEEGVSSGMSVVIRKEEGIYGVLSAFSAEKRSFTDDDMSFLQATANVLSSTIRRYDSHQRINFQGRLLDEVAAAVCVVDTSGQILYWNDAATALLGWTAEDAVGAGAPDILMRPQDVDLAWEVFDTMQPGDRFQLEWQVRAKDGRSIPFQVTVSAPPDTSGDLGRIVLVGVDITEQKEMESRLSESEKQFRSAFMNMTVGMMICDEEGRYVTVNDAFCKMVGYDRDELVGIVYTDITHPDDVADNEAAYSELLHKGGTVERVKRYVHKDGGTVWAEVTDTVIGVVGQDDFRSMVHVVDITEAKRLESERERLEKQLVQSQKMEAIGRLAGGIAHDFNNLLSVIINYAAFVDEDLEDDDPRKEDLTEIRLAGQKATELVRQLLTFARREAAASTILDLNEAVTGMKGLLSRSIGEDIELDLILLEGLPSVSADVSHIEQIVMNLVVNARDAMPQGGHVKVKTDVAELHEVDAATLDVEPGRYVRMSVSDDGDGIPQHVIARIFEPFFTTKSKDHGTGLGLATVYGLAQQHGGCVRVDSEVGRGTRFDVLLPAVREHAQVEDSEPIGREAVQV